MNGIRIIEHDEQLTAGVRETVPMDQLTAFFSRAFAETMAVVTAQGTRPVGPPFGKYHGEPGATVDVEAGFPVASPITATGHVTPGVLPGGRVVEATHVGPYDTMERTYAEVERFITAARLTPCDIMWESYLSDPHDEPDPATWRTEIFWPVRQTVAERQHRSPVTV